MNYIFLFYFNFFAKAIYWLLIKEGWENIFHYLVNFFAILSIQTEARWYKAFFLHFCLELGINIKDEKSLQAKIAEFLNIKLDNIVIKA